MSAAENARETLQQANAATELAIQDLAGPQEGHAVYRAAGQQIQGAADSMGDVARGIAHHLDAARRGINELVENNAKIARILITLPPAEIDEISRALEASTQQIEQVKEAAVILALRGLARVMNAGNDFGKLGSIVRDAPTVDAALQFLHSAFGMTEALEATTL